MCQSVGSPVPGVIHDQCAAVDLVVDGPLHIRITEARGPLYLWISIQEDLINIIGGPGGLAPLNPTLPDKYVSNY